MYKSRKIYSSFYQEYKNFNIEVDVSKIHSTMSKALLKFSVYDKNKKVNGKPYLLYLKVNLTKERNFSRFSAVFLL